MGDMWVMALRLCLAAFLGGIVGYEREIHEHPAGLRTHILVSMGAALITMISLSFGVHGNDPARIAAQIVSGIGFLGAGTIIRQGNVVRGLTTAASLWTVSGIGMAVAIGGKFVFLATVATGIVFLTLTLLRGIEPQHKEKKTRILDIEIPNEPSDILSGLLQKLSEMGIIVDSMSRLNYTEEGRSSYRLRLIFPDGIKLETVSLMLNDMLGGGEYEWG